MIEEIAQVVAINDKIVTVKTDIKTACGQCQQADNCGTSTVAKAFSNKQTAFEITTDLTLELGEQVIIAIPEQALLTAAWQVYLLPLLGLLLSSAVATWWSNGHQIQGEWLTILSASIGGFAGFLLAKHLQQQAQCKQALQPRIIKRIYPSISIQQVQ